MPKITKMTAEEMEFALEECVALVRSMRLPIAWNADPLLMRVLLSKGAVPKMDEGGYEINAEWAEKVLVLASESASVYEYLVRIVSINLRALKRTPNCLVHFAGQVLAGNCPSPKAQQTDAARVSQRDLLVMEMVEFLIKKFHITLGRSSATNAKTVCAYQLVSDAFHKVDMKEVTFDVVKQVWERRNSEPPPLKWSAPMIRKAEDHRWPLRDRSPKRLS